MLLLNVTSMAILRKIKTKLIISQSNSSMVNTGVDSANRVKINKTILKTMKQSSN